MAWNCARQGRRVLSPGLISTVSKAVFAVPPCAIVSAVSLVDRHSLPEWRSWWRASCGPYSTIRRSLFLDATTEQVDLQYLSGSEEGENEMICVIQLLSNPLAACLPYGIAGCFTNIYICLA